MCWNASVSLNTYIFELFASSFAYYNGVTNILDFIFLSIINNYTVNRIFYMV